MNEESQARMVTPKVISADSRTASAAWGFPTHVGNVRLRDEHARRGDYHATGGADLVYDVSAVRCPMCDEWLLKMRDPNGMRVARVVDVLGPPKGNRQRCLSSPYISHDTFSFFKCVPCDVRFMSLDPAIAKATGHV